MWGGEGNWGNRCRVAEEGRRGKLVGGKALTGQTPGGVWWINGLRDSVIDGWCVKFGVYRDA